MANLSNINNKLVLTTDGAVLINQGTVDYGTAKLQVSGNGSTGTITWRNDGGRKTGYLYSDSTGVAIYTTALNNAGIYLADNLRIDFRVNGSERMRIDSAGEVQARRPRSNTAGEVALGIQPSDTTAHYGWRIDQTNNSLNLDYVNTPLNIMTYSYLGNVGIGTASPSARLNVVGVGQANNPTVAIDVTNSDSFNHGLEIFDGNLTTGETVLMAIGHSGSTKLTAIFGFVRNESSLDQNLATIGFWGADNKLTVSGGGNVGIGTSTAVPGAKLEVSADVAKGILISRSFTTSSQTLANVRAYYGLAITPLRGGTGGLYFTNYDADVPIIQSVNTSNVAQSLLLNPLGGNIGIGTTSPTGVVGSGQGGNTTLDVQGPLKNKRVMRGWHHCNPITSSNAYRHIKTNLHMGGGARGNDEYIMGGFEIKGYAYYGSYPGFGHGTCMFHNWSNSFASLQVANYGTTGFVQQPYISSDGYCVIVTRQNSYMQPVIDFAQYYTPYPWRTSYVTAETTSNNLTGVY